MPFTRGVTRQIKTIRGPLQDNQRSLTMYTRIFLTVVINEAIPVKGKRIRFGQLTINDLRLPLRCIYGIEGGHKD